MPNKISIIQALIQGDSSLSVGMDLAIIGQPSQDIPTSPDYTPGDTIRDRVQDFRSALGARERATTISIRESQATWADLTTTVKSVSESTNKILATTPDSDIKSLEDIASVTGTPSSSSSLTTMAQRLQQRFGLITTDGLAFTTGDLELYPLSVLCACVGNNFDDLFDTIENNFESFTICTSYIETRSTTVSDGCANNVLLESEERLIGHNLTIKQSAAKAGIDESEVLVKVFWVGSVLASFSNMQRLLNLGISGANLQAALTLSSTDTLTAFLVQEDALTRLQQDANLDEDQIKELLLRTTEDTPPMNPRPLIGDLSLALQEALNTGPQATEIGTAGSESGVTMIASLVDLARTMVNASLDADGDDEESYEQVTADSVDFDEDDFDSPDVISPPEGSSVSQAALKEACEALRDMLVSGLEALERSSLQYSQEFGANAKNIETDMRLGREAAELSNCVASFQMGSPVAINELLSLPTKLTTLRQRMSATLSQQFSIAENLAAVRCLPESIIAAISGGSCFSEELPVNLFCSADLSGLIDRFRALASINLSFVASSINLLGSLLISIEPWEATITDLAAQVPCQQEVERALGPIFAKVKGLI